MTAPAFNTIPEPTERFARRFRGLERVHGYYTPDKEKKPGKLKLEGNAGTVREPVTLTHYEAHLSGKQGLGIVPVTDEGTCWFGAIDVDQYADLDHAALDEKIDRLGLTLIVCETKSGGAHLYQFFSEAVPAALVRTRMRGWAKALGLPKGVEVFPKQDRLQTDDDCGNWINVPYFGSARPALRNGELLTLDKFLHLADSCAISAKELQELNITTGPKPSSHGLVSGDISEGQRNIKFFKAACRMRGAGAEEEEIRETLLEVNAQMAEPLPESEVTDLARRVARKYEAGTRHAAPDAEDAVAEFNQTYAIVQVAEKVRVLQIQEGHGEFALLPREEFKALHSNRFCMNEEGKRQPAAEVWLRSAQRKQYSKIVFEPGGLWTKGAYNLFSGWAVQPDPTGDCSLFLEHLRENVCRGDEALYQWVFTWLAQLFQQPAKKPGTALVLRGEPGTGKSIVGKIVGKLIGHHHYKSVSRGEEITGRFNSPLERCLLLQAEEAFWAGDKQAEAVLKDKITNDRQWIERKGIDAIEVANHIRFLVTSNADWVVPAGMEERRFAVLDVGTKHIQDLPYFGAMEDQIDAGGAGGLLHRFLMSDLSAANVRVIPSTDALQEQKIASLTPEQKWWLDILMEGALPGDVSGLGICSTQCLHHDYVSRAKTFGYNHRCSVTQFGMILRKLVPLVPGGGALRQRRTNSRGDQVYMYEFPELKVCRQEFDRRMRYRREWNYEDSWTKCRTEDNAPI